MKVINYCLILGGILSPCFFLQQDGFCFRETRYLTAGEKIDRAVEYVLQRYPPPISLRNASREPGKTVAKISVKNPIYYKDVENFLSANEDCCSLTSAAEDGIKGDYFDKLFGYTATFVRINYRVWFLDDSGNKDWALAQDYVAISNCGKSWSGFI